MVGGKHRRLGRLDESPGSQRCVSSIGQFHPVPSGGDDKASQTTSRVRLMSPQGRQSKERKWAKRNPSS